MQGVNLRKLACIILITTILVGGLLLLEEGHATTVPGETIYTNTTWTSASSPYVLTGNVIVNSGVTLTIEPGVTVNFGPYQITVNGILNAQGTSANKIVLSSNNDSDEQIDFTAQADYGCIIDNAIISSVPIVVGGGSPQINNNYFTSTPTPALINVYGGSPLIEKNVINMVSTDGIYVNSGSPTISSNLITGEDQYYGIYIESTATATISNNNITDCWSGIDAVGESIIQQNNVMNNANDGIHSNISASIIQDNAIANNLCGISGPGNIQDNTITDNSAGLWGPSASATITNNNIFDNTENIHLTDSGNVNATYNWWGTADASVINQTIWDFKNAPNLGIVTFVPFLAESNPLAPSIPTLGPVPTPPPTPAPTTTATPFVTPTPTYTPTPTNYTTSTPRPTPILIRTPSSPIFGHFSMTDIDNMVVIALAFTLAVVIIVVINMKFGKPNKPKSKKRRKRRQKSAE
jgi:parallel beta-helix repeat protein